MISIDQMDGDTPGDIAFAAFCEVDGCSWMSGWHHADTQIGYPAPSAFDDAHAQAAGDGDDHLAAEHGEDDGEVLTPGQVLALSIPTLDANGYAR